ncbi:MAG TPA: SDR family oxidoreductase [Lacibacter sp.]|nr:SDR family oxidoreductase [Lacibacter sp.]HMO88605.1 SDR family oxidoreductase [Lacibacter sp.]HMP85965.1 SDR family oxidoreductase [Lacibacter sp.]
MNVIITGASRGIGKAVADIFAAHGHSLYICARNEEVLHKTVQELQGKYPGAKIKAKVRDLSRREDVENFGQWLLDNGMPIDILVNNAGSFLPGSIHNEPEGALEKMLAVNLLSAYHLTRKLLPVMMRQSDHRGWRGHIFSICSIASLQAYPNGGSYSISKYALRGFSDNLREELKQHLIKVTSVFPGAVHTDSWGDFDNSNRRIMEATDIAKMIFAAASLTPQACVESITIRPQLGDL